ncbi:MAG: hypothetical protein ACFBSG_09470 [Leptolyngbyaceae cyanobacterium]
MSQNPDRSPDDVITQALQGFTQTGAQRPDGKVLTAALLELERSAKQARQMVTADELLGRWRLCFTASKKAKFKAGQPIGSGFYIPKLAIAQLAFAPYPEREGLFQITNQLHVGPLKLQFTGPARRCDGKNLLAFDFTRLLVTGFGLPIYRGAVGQRRSGNQDFQDMAIAKLPFFAFFAATEQYIAARGRGGGLALWQRV